MRDPEVGTAGRTPEPTTDRDHLDDLYPAGIDDRPEDGAIGQAVPVKADPRAVDGRS